MMTQRAFRVAAAGVVTAVTAFASAPRVASGQTVINMPAPPRAAAATPNPRDIRVLPETAAPLHIALSEGELALQRYAGMRTGTFDTYPAASYRYRNYSYSWFGTPVFWHHGPFFFGRIHHFGFCH